MFLFPCKKLNKKRNKRANFSVRTADKDRSRSGSAMYSNILAESDFRAFSRAKEECGKRSPATMALSAPFFFFSFPLNFVSFHTFLLHHRPAAAHTADLLSHNRDIFHGLRHSLIFPRFPTRGEVCFHPWVHGERAASSVVPHRVSPREVSKSCGSISFFPFLKDFAGASHGASNQT